MYNIMVIDYSIIHFLTHFVIRSVFRSKTEVISNTFKLSFEQFFFINLINCNVLILC